MSEGKKAVALLTVRGFAVNVTRVEPKEGGGYNFLNDQRLYGRLNDLKDVLDGKAKSVKLFVSTPYEVKEKA